MRDGSPLPQRMQNAPELSLGLLLFYEAFMELHTCRPGGLELSAIPWTAIKDYAKAFEFSDEQTESLFYFIRELDGVYMDWAAKKQKRG